MSQNPPKTAPKLLKKPRSALRDFLASEASGGILLMLAALLAMIIANSPWSESYFHLMHLETGPVISPKYGEMTVHLWINDALMAVFFLLVGLEIKREFTDGKLASWYHRRLPFVAAIAGMVVPAAIFLFIARNHPEITRGWAIPAATDIAFAIGVLALLGSRAPTSIKLLLTTIAIVDDMGAVAIIALGYTNDINGMALLAAIIILSGMMVMNRNGVVKIWPYLIGFALLWFAIFLSGVHATVAGVLAAMTIPIKRTIAAPDAEDSTLHRLEHAIHPAVSYCIVPLFGFANAGVSFAGVRLEHVFAPLPMAIAAGLFIGKQVGIFAAIWASVKTGFAQIPAHANWGHIYGMALLCGIGFTMSLFIGGLAFTDPLLGDEVKIGVLIGSILSAIVGAVVFRLSPEES